MTGEFCDFWWLINCCVSYIWLKKKKFWSLILSDFSFSQLLVIIVGFVLNSTCLDLRLYFLCSISTFLYFRYDIKSKQSDGVLKKIEKIYEEYSKWYLNHETESGGFNPRHSWQLISSKYQEGPSIVSVFQTLNKNVPFYDVNASVPWRLHLSTSKTMDSTPILILFDYFFISLLQQ